MGGFYRTFVYINFFMVEIYLQFTLFNVVLVIDSLQHSVKSSPNTGDFIW